MITKKFDIGCASSARNPFSCDEFYSVDIAKQEVSVKFN